MGLALVHFQKYWLLRGFLEELKVKMIAFEIFRPVAPIDPAMRSMMTSLTALLFLLA